MQKAKNRYRELSEKVRAIINRHDPEGLSPGAQAGTPIDEYDSETAILSAFLTHHQEEIKVNRKILIDKVNQVWQEYFGRPCRSAEQISSEIVRECM